MKQRNIVVICYNWGIPIHREYFSYLQDAQNWLRPFNGGWKYGETEIVGLTDSGKEQINEYYR